ncbi:MAG: class I tRNA ligase family protein [bacterium]|nr:class I tRNA ligase family protein [bacterium]
MEGYDHKALEKKWQEKWAQDSIYTTPNKKEGAENHYVLVEFPYPSGNLHVGHWYAFAMPDIYARFKRMKGFNVLYPFGFDAFGLPAENAAIKRGLDPRSWTLDNIEHMRTQLASMGAMFDWSREVNTADPAYYKWTQWLFIQLYKKGLAYQAKTAVNWCPSCKTVLANEQVVAGLCERCDSEVEQKEMVQWNVKITEYADRLIDDLEPLAWPEPIKDSQRNWIGRSKGYDIDFKLSTGDELTVFTTRPDTLFGVTYLVLAPEHPLVATCDVTNRSEVDEYVTKTTKKSERERTGEGMGKEKTGVVLEGITATNPATGEEIPVWIADYVLAHYASGAIMAVPAHDERDYEFATHFNLPVCDVVEPEYTQTTEPGKVREGDPFDHRDTIIAVVKHWSEEKYIALRWKEVAWGTFVTGGIEEGQTPEDAARMELREETGYTNARYVRELGMVHGIFYHVPKKTNRVAHAHVVYLELENDERVAIDDHEAQKHDVLWLTQDELLGFLTADTHRHALRWLNNTQGAYTGFGVVRNSGTCNGLHSKEAMEAISEKVSGRKRTTYRLRDWIVSRQRYWGCPIPVIHCDACGVVLVPDDQLPVELPQIDDFLPAGDGRSPLAKDKEWVNVSCPSCGGPGKRETDTLDTFVDSSWYFLRYLDSKNEEVFSAKEMQNNWMPIDLYSGGAEHTTMHVLYSRFFHKALYDLGLTTTAEPYKTRMNRGLILGPDGNKMSKSKGNVIDPDDVVARLGADTVRMYLAFIGPYNEVGAYPWSIDSIAGVRRFLEKILRLGAMVEDGIANEDLDRLIHQTIKKVEDSIAKLGCNTGVSSLMVCARGMEETGRVSKEHFGVFVRLLAPFAPHVAEELWHNTLHNTSSVHLATWPVYDENRAREKETTIAVQINGKVRAKLVVPTGMSQEQVETIARENDVVAKWLKGTQLKKVIYVADKLLSIVTGA